LNRELELALSAAERVAHETAERIADYYGCYGKYAMRDTVKSVHDLAEALVAVVKAVKDGPP
jgi:hypothetical protein